MRGAARGVSSGDGEVNQPEAGPNATMDFRSEKNGLFFDFFKNSRKHHAIASIFRDYAGT